jgi:hypothetical protein
MSAYSTMTVPATNVLMPTVSGGTVSVTIGITVNTSGASGKLEYWCGSSSVTTVWLVTGQTSVNISIPDTYANQFTKSKTGTVNLKLETLLDTTSLGTSYASFAVEITSDMAIYMPEFTRVIGWENIDIVDSTIIAGQFHLQNHTKTILRFPTYSAKYGASLLLSASIYGVTYNSTYQKVIDTDAGQIAVTFSATDSRGFTVSETAYSYVGLYDSPHLSNISAVRCLSDGTEDAGGAYIKAKAVATYIHDGVYVGTVTFAASTKESGDSSFANVTNLTSDVYCSPISGFNVVKSVTVKFYLNDGITDDTAEYYLTLPSNIVPFSIKPGGKGVAVGKYADTDDLFESALPFKTPSVQLASPTLYSGTSAYGADMTGYDKYSVFRVKCKIGSSTFDVLCMRNGVIISGIGGATYSGNTTVSVMIGVNNGTVSINNCSLITHTASGSHSAITTGEIAEIVGLI